MMPVHGKANLGTSTVNAWADGVGAGSSGSRDDAQLGKALPGQAQDQGVELRRCE